jgi:hypothetical protein
VRLWALLEMLLHLQYDETEKRNHIQAASVSSEAHPEKRELGRLWFSLELDIHRKIRGPQRSSLPFPKPPTRTPPPKFKFLTPRPLAAAPLHSTFKPRQKIPNSPFHSSGTIFVRRSICIAGLNHCSNFHPNLKKNP